MIANSRLFAAALLVVASHSVAQGRTGPAPSGDAAKVAIQVIRENEHPCPRVTRASRNSDGSISAVCSNSEDYRIFSVNGQPIAMKCSAARRLGVAGC